MNENRQGIALDPYPVWEARTMPTFHNPACAQHPHHDWTRDEREDGKHHPRDLTAMRAICATCTDHTTCLEYALANPVYGIWAGTRNRDRNAIRGRFLRHGDWAQ